jgi:eukaryotic-like serine/threonine-protein kinase
MPQPDSFMAIKTNDQFLTVLHRTGIFEQEQLDEIRAQLLGDYADPVALGEYLVEIDWLTAYQLQMLLGGQWDALIIGPFQILDRLGEGGISEVFKAWDGVRGRVVALKVLRTDLVANGDAVRQFQRELQAIIRLSHPNIIKTFDASQDGAVNYFAMEFVEGMDLDRFVQRVGPLPVDQACDYARQVAQGLQHAHQMGLVHRDIKPANLFLLHPPLPPTPGVPFKRGPDPVVKIIDWGLARCLNAPVVGKTNTNAQQAEEEKGRLIGTADYIAPEQARDASLVDIRADLYSLGCTMYYLLAGRPPFIGPSLMQKLHQHQEAEPASLRLLRPDVPEELDELVLRMLAKQADERPQIPLLVITPLRRFCTAAGGLAIRPAPSAGTVLRPGSSPSLPSPLSGAASTVNLPRPPTHPSLPRPSANSQGHRH